MKENLKKTTDHEWTIPKSVREGMLVDAKILGSKEMLDCIEDQAVEQLTNVSMLPGALEPVCAMPDAHWGYGFPVGSVAAFDTEKGVISAGLCGFDINCGINLIRTNLTYADIKDKMPEIIEGLYKRIPVGVGGKSKVKLDIEKLEEVATTGMKWCIKNGFAVQEDLDNTEENGHMEGADYSKVSDLAKKRGAKQLGTLGAGNHFVEVQKVGEIFDKEFAKKCGITKEDQICIMIHSGSRGFGHQIATDFLKVMEKALEKYSINLPDKQLACAPATSKEGQDYYDAMRCAVNYSFCNRQVMTHWVRETFEDIFEKKWQDLDMHTVYGLCHNVVKKETFTIDGKKKEAYVHRKGATRSYKDQPVLIAGSMGTSSWLMRGQEKSMNVSWGSSAHGAGRAMSRHEALRRYDGEQIQKDLAKTSILSKAPSARSLAEEAPGAYKDVDLVIESIDKAGVSKKTVQLLPIGVIKG